MDAREERTIKAILPNFSGPAVSGAVAVLSTLLLGFAVLGPVGARSTSRALPEATPPRPSTTPREIVPSQGLLEGPALPPRLQARPRGRSAPHIESVSFGAGVVTAARDLRLEIHASDPDGDPVRLRTAWRIDGLDVETATPVLPQSHLRRGATITARVIASDGNEESLPFATQAIVVSNAPPRITTFPMGFDTTGAFVYPIGAIDPDGDRDLQYRLIEGPGGMTIEPHEGILSWIPSSTQGGRHPVQVEVRDGQGGSQLQVFDLVVREHPLPLSDLADLADQTALR